MPNLLAIRPEQRCTATKADGSPCGGLRMHRADTCLAHSDRNPEKVRQRRKAELGIIGNTNVDTLDILMALDPTDATNLQRIRIGLMRHVAAGTIEHQAASACLRFAQAAFDAQVRSAAGSSMSAKLRAQLLSRDEPAPETPSA